MIDDDVKGHYHYRSNFADRSYGIWFCGTKWYIGTTSTSKGKCQGRANSKFNTDQCVHDIGFDWVYSDTSVGWQNF